MPKIAHVILFFGGKDMLFVVINLIVLIYIYIYYIIVYCYCILLLLLLVLLLFAIVCYHSKVT